MIAITNDEKTKPKASIIQLKRFKGEVNILKKEPLTYATAFPDSENPLKWYFIIHKLTESDYDGGHFIGMIEHDKSYPCKPPDYYMFTPNGRFIINTKICLTNSKFHPADWSPSWNIRTILIAFCSIFSSDDTTGIAHIHESPEKRKLYAQQSKTYNLKNYNEIYTQFITNIESEKETLAQNNKKDITNINII